jgi:hypothetical protein
LDTLAGRAVTVHANVGALSLHTVAVVAITFAKPVHAGPCSGPIKKAFGVDTKYAVTIAFTAPIHAIALADGSKYADSSISNIVGIYTVT